MMIANHRQYGIDRKKTPIQEVSLVDGRLSATEDTNSFGFKKHLSSCWWRILRDDLDKKQRGLSIEMVDLIMSLWKFIHTQY